MLKVINQHGIEIPVQHSTFPAGEVYVKVLESRLVTAETTVILLSADSEQIMRAIMIANALKNVGASYITLDAPYLPYSRQDRVCNTGESDSLAVLIGMLEHQFDRIKTLDAHNPKVLDSLVINEQVRYKIELAKYYKDGLVMVAPDKGAIGRCYLAANNYPVVVLNKTRKLSGISQSVESADDAQWIKTAKSLLIVDDICDGGATFISAAKVLREFNLTAELHLFVTHGIFSQGMEKLEEVFSSVRCANRYSR